MPLRGPISTWRTADLRELAVFIEAVRDEPLHRDELLAMMEKPWRCDPEVALRDRYRTVTTTLAGLPDDPSRPGVVLAVLAGLRGDYRSRVGFIDRPDMIAPTVACCDPDDHPLYADLPDALRAVVSCAAGTLEALAAATDDDVFGMVSGETCSIGRYGPHERSWFLTDLLRSGLDPGVWGEPVWRLFVEAAL